MKNGASMKEYICKEDLFKFVERYTIWDVKLFEKFIKNIPTVTKADIRAEVINECINEILKLDSNADYGLLYPHTVCNVLEMLKEKE